jgi:hypothetical protein
MKSDNIEQLPPIISLPEEFVPRQYGDQIMMRQIFDGINEAINSDKAKEYQATEEDAKELTKIMKGLQDRNLIKQMVGEDYLPKFDRFQDYCKEEIEKGNKSKQADSNK